MKNLKFQLAASKKSNKSKDYFNILFFLTLISYLNLKNSYFLLLSSYMKNNNKYKMRSETSALGVKNKLTTFFAIFLLIISFIFLCSNFINIEKKISFYDYNSKNIFPDSKNLNSNIIIFKSNINISDYKIKTNCKNNLKFLWEKKDLYFFNFTLLDPNCDNPIFILSNWKEDFEKTKFELNIEKKSEIFLNVVDYSNNDLLKINRKILTEIQKYSKYKKIFQKSLANIKKNRFYKELIYKQNIINSIINRRSKKYEVPVKGYKIATWLNVIPNAGRPYRNEYTDWIHHWWDIIAPKWTPVSAIDDWVIIRVVENFDFEDISNMKKTWEISYTQKLRNLDILRWQQVWLKTSKWDVIFYSHLTIIYDNIKEWTFIKAWDNIWTIWKTWVPDKDYTNFHLHFPIMKNPYILNKVWKYSYEDIMAWDWYLKWETPDDIIIKQKNIFIEEAF